MGHLSLRSVRKTFGSTPVIQGVDLDVVDGEFLVLVGPSGCGKSTLLRMIAGLETIDDGELLIAGRRANDLRPAERGAAMVFQSYALYPHMTVAENMGFALKMAGEGRIAREAQVQRTAQALQITDLLGRFPKELSGGQRQRVAIGRAIVRQPKVFLFDEPLSNLDAALRVNMRIELRRLHQELRTTIIYVTHDQVEAMTLGDRIAVFNQGRVEQLGPPLTLYQRPANEFVATFLGAPRINLLSRPRPDSTPSHRQLWQAMGGDRRSDTQRIGLRAEHMGLDLAGGGVPARLVHAEHLGDTCLLHMQVDGLSELMHIKLDSRAPLPHTGQAVGLLPDALWSLPFDHTGNLQH